MNSEPTAYSSAVEPLRRQLREAALDHAAFETRLRPCDLARCRATCCHDGAVLSTEEAATISTLLADHPASFSDASLAGVPAIDSSRNQLKTATRPADPHECADDFPPHFPRTRCVFLDPAHRCTLQLLSVELGHHPWFYKPISCWMHPVVLLPASDPSARPRLTLRSPDHDPQKFASCTHCGRPDPTGEAAHEVLRNELATLSVLAGRDFLAELHAPPVSGIREE